MFKSFAAALLSATTLALDGSVTRGANDGSNQENALLTDLINSDNCGNNGAIKLDMWTYIAKVTDADAYEFHGDTVAYVEGAVGRWMQYGMCIEISADSNGLQTWDCQLVEVTVPIADGGSLGTAEYVKQTDGQQFTKVSDWQYKGSRDNFDWANVNASAIGTTLKRDQVVDSAGVEGESTSETSDHNWQVSGDKSHTNCGGQSNFVRCSMPDPTASLEVRMKSGINLHWFRNFKTADAPNYDIQLDGTTDKGVQKQSFGWLWVWNSADTSTTPQSECISASGDPVINTTPVPTAAWTKVYVAPTNPDNTDTDTDTDTTTDEDDWATQTTAHATALLAAIYALAF